MSVFCFLDWVLKNKVQEPVDEGKVSPYIMNRWLSMTNSNIANIINATFNRWNNTDDDKDFIRICRFLRKILPSSSGRIEYIKKSENLKKENKSDEFDDICCSRNMEISMRELLIYKKTLAELKK